MDHGRVLEKFDNRKGVVLINDELPIFIYIYYKSVQRKRKRGNMDDP